tara:strand:- start:97 stop:873 length:777 start_codon:yes stop_codon:yes gene_type:complete
VKNILISFAATIAIILSTTNLKADDHAEQAYFNFQINICKLNEGRTMKQYDASFNDYLKWSKKNDVEVYVARQTPIYPHDDFNNSSGIDWIEILAGSHEVTGKAWDMWLGTKEGQKLASNWQENASCFVKWVHAYPIFVNQKDFDEDKDRVASWNWCTLNDGVEADEVNAQHAMMAKELEKNSNGLSGWLALAPQTGAAYAPGDFAHLAVFKDIESYMKYKESLASGGWRGYREYQKNFATCRGEELFTDIELNNPNN